MLTGLIAKMRAALSPSTSDPVKEWARIVRRREAQRKRAQRKVDEIQEIYFDVLQSCQELQHVYLLSTLSERPRMYLERHLDTLERKLTAAQNAEAAARRNLSHARLMAGSGARR